LLVSLHPMSRLILVLVGVACLLGCRTAAGATRSSSPEYDAAQAAIARAEAHLQAQEYGRARLAALQAKRHAAAALANAPHADTPAAVPN
jgi:hypothetical protein